MNNILHEKELYDAIPYGQDKKDWYESGVHVYCLNINFVEFGKEVAKLEKNFSFTVYVTYSTDYNINASFENIYKFR